MTSPDYSFHILFQLVILVFQINYVELVTLWINNLQFNLKRGGQRVATMLMYLTDGVEGGETHFPQVSWICTLWCVACVCLHVMCCSCVTFCILLF
jgi:hypothetical protein